MAIAIPLSSRSMPTDPKLNPVGLLPPFEVTLPTDLRRFGERALFDTHFLTRGTYSTRRFLCGDPSIPDVLLRSIPVARGFSLECEADSPDLRRYCGQYDLELRKDAHTDNAIGLVQAALLEVIQPHPFLWHAVAELAWRCHIVLARDDDFDISFSDPAIPFSIFISAPARRNRNSVLRVAENLVHETMHLQLTLFERCRPLIDTTIVWSMYSPWKQQDRPAQGILHGLYVFHVLDWMWHQIAQTAVDDADRSFALRRIREIEGEIDAVRSLEQSPALTEEGSLFLRQLLGSQSGVRDLRQFGS
jgi:hypothetical protein